MQIYLQLLLTESFIFFNLFQVTTAAIGYIFPLIDKVKEALLLLRRDNYLEIPFLNTSIRNKGGRMEDRNTYQKIENMRFGMIGSMGVGMLDP